jgi:hypothetical protein
VVSKNSALSTSLQQLFLREKLAQEKKKQEARIHKTCLRAMERSKEKSEGRSHALSESYETSRVLLDEVDRELHLFHESKATKTRRQFEDWNNNVHGEISRRINERIDTLSPKALHKQKLADYDKFLETINRKRTLFRDIILENEYDPLEVNRRMKPIVTGRLKDSTQIDKQKLESESGRIERKVITKETLPVEIWADGKIQATPFGRKAGSDDIDGDNNHMSPSPTKSKIRNKTQLSNVVFNDFSYPKGRAGRDQLATEMPRGKATFPKKVYANPSAAWDMSDEAIQEVLRIAPSLDDLNTY